MQKTETSKRWIYWKKEEPKSSWDLIPDTPKARAQALANGAMFFTWATLSEPYTGNGSDPIRFGDMVLDFDNENDPQAALNDMRNLCLIHLPELYSVDAHAIKFYASGKKGFHGILPASLFGADGDKNLPLIYRGIALKWVEMFNLATLDTSLYSMKRGKMFRIANVKRQNSRYKVPLTLSEVQSMSIEDLLEFSKKPRSIEPPDGADLSQSDSLRKIYDQSRKKVYAAPKKAPTPSAPVSKAIRPCISHILSAQPAKSERVNFNKLTMTLVDYFQYAGFDESSAWDQVQGFISSYPHSETYRDVKSRTDHWN